MAKFFLEKEISSNEVDQEYQEHYVKAEELTRKKVRKGLKDLFVSTGTLFLKIVLGASVQAGIKEIKNKITK